ncbi:MAG: 2-oxo acid dehydrogenase subunit E2 [Planctomycetes bacterium]|nr:2-oxo acid dehydrogenase subunit E2 [Planctomycetota bacterium]
MAVLVDVLLPPELQKAGESIIERWLHKPGARVRANEPLVEINTDKAVVEVPAPADGVLKEILKQDNDAVLPGDVLGRIATDASVAAPSTSTSREPSGTRQTGPARLAGPTDSELLSPAVRQLVRQHQIDVAQIHGSGRGSRITVHDVENYLASQRSSPAAERSASRKIPHSPMRRRIAQHMVESALRTAPHVTAVFEADLSAVVAHLQQHKADFERDGVKLTFSSYFVAAAVKALRAVPEVNGRWHDDGLEVFEDCNIGIATAVPGGLIVPVIQKAQDLDLIGIASRIQELTAKARAGKLELRELQDGTFTVTNHGVSGSLIATPIIVQPQVAILGIGKLEKRAVVVESDGSDSIQIKPMAYVTLTIDHRALDGAQANAFLSKFVEALAGW